MSDSRQLEREAEETRHQLARTLGELRERITPGELLDQVLDYARDSGGGEFVRNLGRQATANPLSVCLIGAGLAWLALSNGRSSPAPYWLRERGNGGPRSRPSRSPPPSSQRPSPSNHGVGEAAAAGYEAAKSGVGAAADAISDAAAAGYETARASMEAAGEAMSEAASDAVGSANDAIGNGWDFIRRCAEEPAVVAGIGVAIGAALGAALPSSELEDKLVGDTSDRLKDQATDFTREQYERTKSKAKEAMQGAVQEAVEDAGERLHAGLSNGSASVQSEAPAGQTPDAPERGA